MSNKRRRRALRLSRRHHAPRPTTHQHRPLSRSPGHKPILELFSYQITDEPLDDPLLAALPAPDQERIQGVEDGCRRSPADYVRPLEQLVEEFPHLPKLHNHLMGAYEAAGMPDEAHQLIRETYRRFPNYLFALASYASLCLHEGKIEDVPTVFRGGIALQQLYPDRNCFHVSEVLAFHGTVAHYFICLGQQEQARTHYKLMHRLAPDHAVTRRIGNMLETLKNDSILRDVARRLPRSTPLQETGP